MMWKLGAAARSSSKSQSLGASYLHRSILYTYGPLIGSGSSSSRSSLVVVDDKSKRKRKKKKRELLFNVVLNSMEIPRWQQCLVTLSETPTATEAHAYPPHSISETNMDFPAIPGTCTVANSNSSTTSYVVGGLTSITPSPAAASNLLFSLDSADLLPPLPSSYTPNPVIPPPWKFRTCMRTFRKNPQVLPHDGKLFIFGGCSSHKSWLEIFDTSTGKIQSRNLPPNVPMEPLSCFLWDDLFLVHFHLPHPSLYSYSPKHNTWELFDDNFPHLMAPESSYRSSIRNLVRVGRDTIFIIDKSDLWLVYDLPSRQLVGQLTLEGVPEGRDALKAFICPSSKGDSDSEESWVIRMFVAGDDARKLGITEIYYHHVNMPYARVRIIRPRGDNNFVAHVESLADIAIDDPYMEGTLIFPLQNLKDEEEEEEEEGA